jgi:hypothetical protein
MSRLSPLADAKRVFEILSDEALNVLHALGSALDQAIFLPGSNDYLNL